MILDIIKDRYTAKHWIDQPIEEEKIEKILEAAYLAPKKSGKELFLIHVLQDSDNANNLRSWLYESTVEENIYQGEYHAPLILTFSVESNHRIAKMNLGVCSAFALLCAEEMGLRTSLTCCHDRNILANKLDLEEGYMTELCLCIGYAEKDTDVVDHKYSTYYRNIDGGRDLKNIDSSFRTYHPKRNNYKSREQFIFHV